MGGVWDGWTIRELVVWLGLALLAVPSFLYVAFIMLLSVAELSGVGSI